MGSTKDLVMDDSYAGRLYQAPEPHKFGFGAWKVSGRFSVADMKGLIPKSEIPQKHFVLAMTAARYWEAAAQVGLPSCYVGMLDANGKIVDTQTLLDRGELSDLVVMKLANTPKGNSKEDLADYHAAIQSGALTVYVADAESIFRAGFPLGSSSFKKMFELAGRKGEYEHLAMYEETVGGLDQIRKDIAEKGMDHFPDLKTYLTGLGLSKLPNPGLMMEGAVSNFTTKFAIGGDEDITEEMARLRMGLGEREHAAWKEMAYRDATHQRAYCKDRGLSNVDGKTEAVVAAGCPLFGDFACTVDENRLMLIYLEKETEEAWLIPSNKEIQRAVFRARGIYAARDRAKERYGDEWHGHLYEFIDKSVVEEATRDSINMMASAIGTVGNKLLGANGSPIFSAKPIGDWVAPFLPYASKLEYLSKEKSD